ncbi:MAG: hypothetical protein DRI80_14935, partial [Chloroflexota bacterium]
GIALTVGGPSQSEMWRPNLLASEAYVVEETRFPTRGTEALHSAPFLALAVDQDRALATNANDIRPSGQTDAFLQQQTDDSPSKCI